METNTITKIDSTRQRPPVINPHRSGNGDSRFIDGHHTSMIDSHCHLADAKFSADLADVIIRAQAAGIAQMICIGDTLPESKHCVELTTKHPELFATCGVHPHHAKDWKEGDLDALTTLIRSSKKVVAVGEIGLDYHYNFSLPEIQKEVFRLQLLLAKELNLPAVIHCREAVSDIKAIIHEVSPPRLVIHCCTEKWDDVAWVIDAGHFLSFTGIATYKNADGIRDTINHCPLEQLMIETDAPYLAPVPHRGKRNEPAFVLEVAKLIAELKGTSLDEIDVQTTRNTVEFFALPT